MDVCELEKVEKVAVPYVGYYQKDKRGNTCLRSHAVETGSSIMN